MILIKKIQYPKQKNKESKSLEFKEIATEADDMKFDLVKRIYGNTII